MLIYVACWPLLASLAGKLIPAIGEGKLSSVIRIILLSLSLFLVQKIAQFGQDILLAGPSLRVSQDLRSHFFGQLQRIKLRELENISSGDITYRLTEDADRVGEILYKTIQDTIPSFLQLLVVFSYMLFLDWKLSLSTLIIAPIITVLVSNFGAKVLKAAEKSQLQVSELAGLLAEAIQGLPLVRAFAAENWLQKRFDHEISLHRKARYKTLRLLALQHPVIGFIEAAGILTVFALGAARIESGGMNSSEFSSYVAALLMLIDPISHLTTNFNEIQQGRASLKRLTEIETKPRETPDLINSKRIDTLKGHVIFKNISFAYIDNNFIIKNFSLNIEAGKVIALVGPSGSGKSTLMSLLLKFNIAQKGQIFIDGLNINDIRTSDLRSQIALVPQNSTVFSGSISDAISIGREVSQSQIIRASKQANAHEFIKKLPFGYQTKLGEKGNNISGGQLQRISIARAVLCNPSLLLLDEATSSLDADAEAAVQIGLKQAMNNRTVFIIAHRLSTVQEADQIILLEDGSIVDAGSHDELINKEGRYRELCDKQLIRKANPS